MPAATRPTNTRRLLYQQTQEKIMTDTLSPKTDSPKTDSPVATRTVDGRQVPPSGVYTVDAAHSSVEFVARHLVVAKTRGRFASYTAEIVIADRPEESVLSVDIDAASISTGDDGRDAHLKSPDFLDVDNHPNLRFVSTSVTPQGDVWKVTGNFTAAGVTKPLTLDVEFNGVTTDPWGNTKAFFSARGEFDRDAWGVSFNQPLANGGALIGKKVVIELEIEAAPVPTV